MFVHGVEAMNVVQLHCVTIWLGHCCCRGNGIGGQKTIDPSMSFTLRGSDASSREIQFDAVVLMWMRVLVELC